MQCVRPVTSGHHNPFGGDFMFTAVRTMNDGCCSTIGDTRGGLQFRRILVSNDRYNGAVLVDWLVDELIVDLLTVFWLVGSTIFLNS